MGKIAADALGWKMKAAAAPRYTLNHPKWYRKRVSTYWWLERWPYTKFVLREISSVFVAFFVVSTLLQIRALSRGPQAYADYQNFLKNPFVLALNVVSFFFVVLHTVTWLNLAARAMPVRVAGKKVPELLISATNYAAWAFISAVVAWFSLRG
jgi:fumarate reductase subunit C